MTFTARQLEDLTAPLLRTSVKTRVQGKSEVSYIEGWHAIAESNRIFGFSEWNRETIEMRVIRENPYTIGKESKWPKEGWNVSYLARIKITVFLNADRTDGSVIREGVGVGHGIDQNLGQAHESAAKEAETDAMKRALMTFGNQFGLALYDKKQANVEDGPTEEEKAAEREDNMRRAAILAISETKTLGELESLYNSLKADKAFYNHAHWAEIVNAVKFHKTALQKAQKGSAVPDGLPEFIGEAAKNGLV